MEFVELEQFLHPFESRGFVSVSWAFLLKTMDIIVNRGPCPLSRLGGGQKLEEHGG